MAKLSSYIKSGSLASPVSGFSTVPPLIVGGTTATGTSSQNLQVTGGGYFSSSVGINTVSPIGNLQVNATTSSFVVTGVGSVGIGLTDPRFKLEVGAVGASGTSLYVNGDARVTGILSVGQGTITINGNADKITAPKFEYAGISSTITATAVDVFVYDTRKDSDGGAWRKRTQHTSWYNETLNTATRGSRKDFPAVAVIVATTTTVTIYDGDDPDMPMWMVIPSNTVDWASNPGDATSLFCLNGILSIGTIGAGTVIFEFISDRRMIAYTTPGYQFLDKSISARGIGSYTSAGGYIIVSSSCNDVAMTVLPNAPIDAATGLPVPTIAVATLGGLSIIKDDGTIINGTSTSGSNYSNTIQVTITEEGYLWWLADYNNAYSPLRDSYALSLNTIPSSNFTWDNASDNLSTGLYYAVTTGNEAGEIKIGPVNTWAWTKQQRNALGGSAGLAIHKPNIGAESNSLVVGITTTYNTGWMHGDIKGAWLSDTSTASVTGTELHPNGNWDFSSTNVSYISNTASGTATVVSGQLQLSGGTSNYSDHIISISTVVGKQYVITIDYVTAVAGQQIGIYHQNTNAYLTASDGQGIAARSSGTKLNWHFTAVSTSTGLDLVTTGTTANIHVFDNWSIRLAEPDRSVNNKGLAVYGTITKSAVATGADLVAYSGFTASNHLRQPPNSGMNIGTGDAYEMIWYKTSSTSGTMMLISYEGGVNGTTDYGKPFNIRMTDGLVHGWGSHNNFSTYDDVQHGVSTADGTWHHVAWIKRGQVFELYVDGKFIGSDTGAVGSNALSDANSELVIGARKRGKVPGDSEEPFTGFLALAKIGKTAPSPAQILKIYNDEKMLFQENSQCTLYGSSDAVTALAYDDSNSLLSVGTSSGRSDFRGLERINNTTTAVTTAISASNGLIAEQ